MICPRFQIHNPVLTVCFVVLVLPMVTDAVRLNPRQGRKTAAGQIQKLTVLKDRYPRVYFFRQSESLAANKDVSYQKWQKAFERLMGIEGKVLEEEEVRGRSIRNIDFFTRFKQRHPEQLVLLHFNGNARDPCYESARFFAGHWIYYNGTKILSDVPAQEGITDIHVENPQLFKVNMGRYGDRNEDIGLCMLDADGRPHWHVSEKARSQRSVKAACSNSRMVN